MTRLTIDFISVDESGTYGCYLIDLEPWTDEPERIQAVAERLQAAINWLAEGGLAERYPEAQEAPARVVFEYAQPPNPAGAELFERARLAAAGVGVELAVRPQ